MIDFEFSKLLKFKFKKKNFFFKFWNIDVVYVVKLINHLFFSRVLYFVYVYFVFSLRYTWKNHLRSIFFFYLLPWNYYFISEKSICFTLQNKMEKFLLIGYWTCSFNSNYHFNTGNIEYFFCYLISNILNI